MKFREDLLGQLTWNNLNDIIAWPLLILSFCTVRMEWKLAKSYGQQLHPVWQGGSVNCLRGITITRREPFEIPSEIPTEIYSDASSGIHPVISPGLCLEVPAEVFPIFFLRKSSRRSIFCDFCKSFFQVFLKVLPGIPLTGFNQESLLRFFNEY